MYPLTAIAVFHVCVVGLWFHQNMILSLQKMEICKNTQILILYYACRVQRKREKMTRCDLAYNMICDVKSFWKEVGKNGCAIYLHMNLYTYVGIFRCLYIVVRTWLGWQNMMRTMMLCVADADFACERPTLP